MKPIFGIETGAVGLLLLLLQQVSVLGILILKGLMLHGKIHHLRTHPTWLHLFKSSLMLAMACLTMGTNLESS